MNEYSKIDDITAVLTVMTEAIKVMVKRIEDLERQVANLQALDAIRTEDLRKYQEAQQ